MAEICQNRTAGVYHFFRPPSVAQIEKCKTNESEKKNQGRMLILLRNCLKFWLGTRFFMVTAQNLFLDSNSPENCTFSH